MKEFVGYRCSLCGAEYTPDQVKYTCPKDGGNLNVVLDYETIRKKYQIEDITSRDDNSLWRYLPLLPVADPGGSRHCLARGWLDTSLFAPVLMKKLGLNQLWIKDEGKNPSASFKDGPAQLWSPARDRSTRKWW